MNTGFAVEKPASTPRIWAVGALCLAVAQALDAKFNPVAVRGEISGFSRAASGHCYFTLKDEQGQLRCAMFRRVADALDFSPANGHQVELRGRLGVYEARGELQLVVEGLKKAGQGSLFEQFMRLKAHLQAQGLFDAGRKRALPAYPRGIGVVTSPGAAALHDVLSALRRRVPHLPVVFAPASVQGAQAPAELIAALQSLAGLAADSLSKKEWVPHYPRAETGFSAVFDETAIALPAPNPAAPVIDVILLVRGGGAIEDLWAFNDERLAQAIARCPLPVICGVGHETDFTIADFVADLRAPTPTAAAELVAAPRQALLDECRAFEQALRRAVQQSLDRQHQRLDAAARGLARPQSLLARQNARLNTLAQRLKFAMLMKLEHENQNIRRQREVFIGQFETRLSSQAQRLQHGRQRLELLNPQRVLDRGYALLTSQTGHALTQAAAARPGQALNAQLADGRLALQVQAVRLEDRL